MSYFESEAHANSHDYFHLKTFSDGSQAALHRFLYTTAILSGLNHWGYEDRWCYSDTGSAKEALDKWDGSGEPEGWHRHPASGRRIGDDGVMYVRA